MQSLADSARLQTLQCGPCIRPDGQLHSAPLACVGGPLLASQAHPSPGAVTGLGLVHGA
jgi:hypothetical protein